MSHKPSGLWCDLCNMPILEGDWWNVSVNLKPGHSCQKCKEEYEKKNQEKKKEETP